MHQQPPKTPLFASTSPANASQLDSSRALIVYPDPTSTQPSPPGRMALGRGGVLYPDRAGPRPLEAGNRCAEPQGHQSGGLGLVAQVRRRCRGRLRCRRGRTKQFGLFVTLCGCMAADSDRVVDIDVGASAHGSFETWYRSAHPRLLATLTVISGDIETARDATAEAFTRALERWPRVPSTDVPEAWVQRVGVSVLRRWHRRRVVEERRPPPHAPEPAPPAQLGPDVWDALAALPSRQREAIALRYLLDLTQADVAEAMGVAPGTAAATLHAARRNLADRLELDDTDDVEVASRD